MIYCTNCDTEAVKRMICTDECAGISVLDFCAQCLDAFEWGQCHANSDIIEEDIEQEEEVEP